MPSILARERTVAGPGFNRWLVPPAALCVHLSIGSVYAFSVFNLPLTRLLGGATSAPDDWTLKGLGWIFSIAIAFLGIASALFGGWLDRVGPRRAMVTAALCFGGGLLVASLGIAQHRLWLLYLGYGVLGGCGLGLGYISPVKTLMSWFPDRPGMATGLAIMGFGGGAMIASPLSVMLMDAYGTPGHLGVAQTFATLGLGYAAFMLVGAAIVRVPAAGWAPPGYVPRATALRAANIPAMTQYEAVKTRQFWLIWAVLCLNVTAGIGVLEQASAMSQEMFPGRITPTAAAGFVGLLSLFNMGGRFLWASASDRLGRKATYAIFFTLGFVLYALVPSVGRSGNIALFVLCYGVILSMYGGGFATVPAYLRDIFGLQYVGAIHGRLLTAWSVAGVLGPVLVNYLRAWQIDSGVPRAEAYTVTMYVMAALLLCGLVCNLLIRPLREDDRDIAPGLVLGARS
ncbi:MAG: L-lactate MFS transporter [Janthinobacterium lividum]